MRAEGGVEPNDKEKHSFLGRFGYPLKLFEYPNQFLKESFDAWRKLQNTDLVTKCFLFPLATTRFNYPR